MTTPVEFIDSIITNAIGTATSFTSSVEDAADDLIRVKGGEYFPPPETASNFNVTAIEPDIPTTDETTYNYEVQLAKLIDLLSDELADFFAKYYPLASDAFDEAQAWLVNVITNGGTGINPAVENAIWQRDRERLIADGRRVEGQITTGFAAKNYFMPAGAMLKKISEARYEQAGKIGQASTAQAAKQLEIEIETVKFAIGQAITSRTRAMNAAADYIRAIASAPATAIRVAELNSDVKAKMMTAASNFYRTRLSRDEIILRSKLAETELGVSLWNMKKQNATAADSVDASALSSAADAYARAASAALASLNSVVSTATNSFQ